MTGTLKQVEYHREIFEDSVYMAPKTLQQMGQSGLFEF